MIKIKLKNERNYLNPAAAVNNVLYSLGNGIRRTEVGIKLEYKTVFKYVLHSGTQIRVNFI